MTFFLINMRYRSNNILALVSPVKTDEPVLKQSLFFQRELGMRVFIYNIVEKPSLFEKIFHAKRTKNLRNELLEQLRAFVEKIAPAESLNHLSYRVKMGNPLRILIRQSKNGGYEFIIIEKNGAASTLDREETDKLISRSYCPVMTINKDFLVEDIKKIIIPIDISQSTQKKLLWATYFAKKFGAEITIVTALTMNIEARQSLAWRNAEKLKHMLSQRNVECRVEILKARGEQKHKVILNYIEQEKPGLVIIRTHQESNMSGTQIGKFVSELVHGCQAPVFTVNRYLYPMPVDFEL